MLEVCISPSLTMYLGHSRRALSRSRVKSAVLCVFGELLLGCSALDIILNFEWYLLSKNYKKRFRHFCNVLMHCEWTSSLLAERKKTFTRRRIMTWKRVAQQFWRFFVCFWSEKSDMQCWLDSKKPVFSRHISFVTFTRPTMNRHLLWLSS